MHRNHAAMLMIVFITLAASAVWQQYVFHAKPAELFSYAVWLAFDAVAAWAIFSIAKIKPVQINLRAGGDYLSLFLFIVGAAGVYGLGSNVIAKASGFFEPTAVEQFGQAMQVNGVTSPNMSAFMTTIASPIAEEIIFRVGILGALLLIMRKPWAIVLSSVAFGIMHFNVYSWVAVAGTIVFGLIAAITYLLWGFRAAILLHVFANTKDLYMPVIKDSENYMKMYVVLLIIGVAFFLFYLVRNRKAVLQ